MDDLIRRAAAIDAVESMLRRKFGIGGDLAEITLAGLPSAQPEPLTVNFARELDRETIEKLKDSMKNAPVLIMAVNDSARPELKRIPCSECRHYEADIMGHPWGVCCHPDWVAGELGHEVDKTGWCYRAERRTDE